MLIFIVESEVDLWFHSVEYGYYTPVEFRPHIHTLEDVWAWKCFFFKHHFHYVQ